MPPALHMPARFVSPGSHPAGAALIGVFDSGVGGLSVLRALQRALPDAAWLYVADCAHAPYGERSTAYVVERSTRIAQHLFEQGCSGLVVACNTATAIAIDTLRERWPQHPVVGVEPGLKPAVVATRNGRIGVLATPATLASTRYRSLIAAQPARFHIVNRPCPDLAGLIEQGESAEAALSHAIASHCTVLRQEEVDTVVLGCTHYAFVRQAIAAQMGNDVHIVDTADAVAQQAVRRFVGLPVHPEAHGSTLVPTQADSQTLRRMAGAWLTDGHEVKKPVVL